MQGGKGKANDASYERHESKISCFLFKNEKLICVTSNNSQEVALKTNDI